MRRRLLKVKTIGVLSLILILFVVVGVAEQERTDASGQWMYTLEDGGATITWITAEDPTGDLVIPSELDGYPVIGIGKHAFAECENLTTVTIPEGVTSIGDSAFIHCLGLVSVTLPESLTRIGEMAFYRCGKLTSVVIPESVATIGDGAFEACRSLTHVTLPDNLNDIGDEVFNDCKKVTLLIAESSYAEQYAKKNKLKFSYKIVDQTSQERSVDGPHQIQPSDVGYECSFAYIGGWTLTKKCSINKKGELEWGFYGQAGAGEEDVLLTKRYEVAYTSTIIPCGDSFVNCDGSRWLVRKPGKKPQALPIKYYESVFYGFDGGCWYLEEVKDGETYTHTLYSIGLDGKNKRLLGSVEGFVVGVLADSSVVVADYYGANTISAWKDGAYTVLYTSPDEKLGSVYASEDSIWMSRSGSFGRIENGALLDRQEGHAQLIGRTAHQLVFLVRDHLEADEATVLLINDRIRSYTYLGRVPFVKGNGKGLELHSDHVVYWGKGRHVLDIPADLSAWTSYEH